jgi:alkanesulfonate monooxygenase SsuD/methylene tetrahydromethanopterin reductase-like flavin-dependent oxidoreductase (luciferase family)
MTPVFDPGPNPHGPPPVFIGGFGPRMIEVADGLIVHPFNTRRSVEELVLPALARGRATVDRDASAVKPVWVTMVVTWATDEEHAIATGSVKDLHVLER